MQTDEDISSAAKTAGAAVAAVADAPRAKRGRGRPRVKTDAEHARDDAALGEAARAKRAEDGRAWRAARRLKEEAEREMEALAGVGGATGKTWREMTDREVREEFETLASKAVAMMDANQFEAYDGRRERVRRKLAMNGMESVPVDEAKVRRCVVALAQGVGFREALKICGQADFMDAKDAWMPDVSVAYGLIRRRRSGFMEMLRDERMVEVEEALVRAATEPGFKVDTKAAMFVAENGDRKRWGARLPDGGGAVAGGAKVTYNNPQLTVNMIMSPRELEERKANEGVAMVGVATEGMARVVEVAKRAAEDAVEAEVVGVAPKPAPAASAFDPKNPPKVVIPKFKVAVREA